MCNSFQNRVVSVIVKKTMRAINEYGVKNLVLAGGVAANSYLRKRLTSECEKDKINFSYPKISYCTDNAAMIGVAAYYEYMNGTRHGWDLNAVPNLKLGER